MTFRVALKRAYDPPRGDDGPRVLVDRVWPRGVSKDRLRIVSWMRDIAPSTRLRTWFGHDATKWDEFRRRYRAELAANSRLLDELADYARDGRLTLVFGARDPVHNQAAVIREVLEARRAGGARPNASRRLPSSRRAARSAGRGHDRTR
jgi:uncharacterized protein YeaO (DUF488 family)